MNNQLIQGFCIEVTEKEACTFINYLQKKQTPYYILTEFGGCGDKNSKYIIELGITNNWIATPNHLTKKEGKLTLKKE